MRDTLLQNMLELSEVDEKMPSDRPILMAIEYTKAQQLGRIADSLESIEAVLKSGNLKVSVEGLSDLALSVDGVRNMIRYK